MTWKVNVTMECREDGGLRVYSDDLPGLILSGRDPRKVAADIPTAIQILMDYKNQNAAASSKVPGAAD